MLTAAHKETKIWRELQRRETALILGCRRGSGALSTGVNFPAAIGSDGAPVAVQGVTDSSSAAPTCGALQGLDSFDCSGRTQYVFGSDLRHVGNGNMIEPPPTAAYLRVSLPHARPDLAGAVRPVA